MKNIEKLMELIEGGFVEIAVNIAFTEKISGELEKVIDAKKGLTNDNKELRLLEDAYWIIQLRKIFLERVQLAFQYQESFKKVIVMQDNTSKKLLVKPTNCSICLPF